MPKFKKMETMINKCEKSFPGDHFSAHGDKRRWEQCDCAYCTPPTEGIARQMQKIKLIASLDKEYLYGIAKQKNLNLEGDALRMFMHFNEIEIDVWIDTKTGKVTLDK